MMNTESWPPATASVDPHRSAATIPYLQIREELRRALIETLDRLLPQLLEEKSMQLSARSARSVAPCMPLTLRERQILNRIAAGDSNKEIARALELSPHTVKRHVANILNKLGVSSRVQAAAWARACH